MAIKTTNGETSDWIRAPPPTGSLWQRFAKTIYNSDEKTCFGRTAKGWGIVLLFYLVFYSVLALMFALCMGGLFLTLDSSRPTHVLTQSLIGSSPGVTFRPNYVMSYNMSDPDSYEVYVRELASLLAPYVRNSLGSQTNCTIHDNFGIPERPCVFVKLNKIFDWKPDYCDEATEETPEDLKEYISSLPDDQKHQVWVSCWVEGDNTTSVPIEYPWGRGMAGESYSWPFQNQEGFLSPLLAVRVMPPVDVVTVVRCRAVAKNIIYNKSIKEPSGYARLSILIHGNT